VGKNADTVRKFVEAANKGNIQGFLQYVDDNVSMEFGGSVFGGTYRGKKAVIELLQKVGQLSNIRVKNILESGETVVAEWTTTWKLANGKQIENRVANIMEFSGGKIVNLRGYDDTEQFARAAGKL